MSPLVPPLRGMGSAGSSPPSAETPGRATARVTARAAMIAIAMNLNRFIESM